MNYSITIKFISFLSLSYYEENPLGQVICPGGVLVINITQTDKTLIAIKSRQCINISVYEYIDQPIGSNSGMQRYVYAYTVAKLKYPETLPPFPYHKLCFLNKSALIPSFNLILCFSFKT